MQKSSLYKWLPCLLFVCSAAFAQDIQEYAVKRAVGPMKIDGILNEADWAASPPTKDFVVLGSSPAPAKTTTWAKVLWDDQFMYIAFYCQDVNVWGTYKKRDDQLYQEDAVELYIDADGDGKNYIELEVNPLNTIFDLWLTKPWADGGSGTSSWNFIKMSSAVTVKGTVSNASDVDESWTVEMALPFAEMKFAANALNYPPLDGESWRFNLFRFDRSKTNDANAEQTGWNQTGGGQHVPAKFGRIVFEGNGSTGVPEVAFTSRPTQITLFQNFPNPFNNSTKITYNLHENGNIRLAIYDARGILVNTLFSGHQSTGFHEIKWDADKVASGIYVYRLTSANVVLSRKCLIIK